MAQDPADTDAQQQRSLPLAPAIVNALYLVDGVRRRELPVRKKR